MLQGRATAAWGPGAWVGRGRRLTQPTLPRNSVPWTSAPLVVVPRTQGELSPQARCGLRSGSWGPSDALLAVPTYSPEEYLQFCCCQNKQRAALRKGIEQQCAS